MSAATATGHTKAPSRSVAGVGRSVTSANCGTYYAVTRTENDNALLSVNETNESPPAMKRRRGALPLRTMTTASQAPAQLFAYRFSDQVSLISRRVSTMRHGRTTLPSHCFPLLSAGMKASGVG